MSTYDTAIPIKCKRPEDHKGGDKWTNCYGTHCVLCELEMLREIVKPALDVCNNVECVLGLLDQPEGRAPLAGWTDERSQLATNEKTLSDKLKTLWGGPRVTEAHVCDLRPFYGFPDGPDRVTKFLKALRAKFPYSTFRADVEREMQVFASNAGDSLCVDRIRTWCEGYTAGL